MKKTLLRIFSPIFIVALQLSPAAVLASSIAPSQAFQLASQIKTASFIHQSLTSLQDYLDVINFAPAKNLLTPQNDVVVAIIDDGVAINKSEIQDSIWTNTQEIPGDGIDNDHNGYIDDVNGYNFIENSSNMATKGSHATAVAGIIASKQSNGIGITGLSSNTKIMSLIACDANGSCDSENIDRAIKYAADNGAKIINMSLVGQGTHGFSTIFNDSIRYAYNKGAAMIVAAGNGDPQTGLGYNLDKIPESPVCNDNNENMVLGVGAMNKAGTARVDWSNYGSCVDVYAPGENIVTLSPKNNVYTISDGTSFSAPIVAGLAAQALAAYPSMSNQQLYAYLSKNVNENGVIDASKLFADVQDTQQHLIASNEPTTIPENPISTSPATTVISTPLTLPKTTLVAQPLTNLNYFTDVSSTSKNALAINYLKQQNVINGFADNTFKSDQQVTRAEMLKMLVKGALKFDPPASFAQSCFPDVQATDWYAPYVCYAKARGWVQGYADGTFRPNQPINKVESIKFLVTMNDLSSPTMAKVPFSDVNANAWFNQVVTIAYNAGILEENGNLLHTNHQVTRGELAENIFRIMAMHASKINHFDSSLLAFIENPPKVG